MMTDARLFPGDAGGSTIGTLVACDGSEIHAHAAKLAAGGRDVDPRDLADAVHFWCLLHGRYPGVIDHAALRTAHGAARAWLIDASSGFAAERAGLAKLVMEAGPLPSTPGHAIAEAAIGTQRHALEVLAQSDREGCAIGAALALALDWPAIRAVLDAAARRFGVEQADEAMPAGYETVIVAAAIADRPAVERALMFGAGQLLAQHRALWDVLEARAGSRR